MLSICIVAYGRPRDLDGALRSIESCCSGSGPEVIVVDNGSDDEVEAVVARYQGIHLVRTSGISGTRRQ